ncbi:MAG TPA: cupredoxin domain-containing protein [Candidatus Dormibacteraeota bacterium]|nr:cupredoxin domain-containing protein [Candidatus Dormibacteraeota bacterium]
MTGPTLRSLLAAGAVLALAACGGAQQAGAAATPGSAGPPSASPTAAASPVATTSVAIANFAFSPAAITVRAGSTVTWTNHDQDAHTVAIAGLPASPPLQNAETFTLSFAQPGTYTYICSIHPFMRGMVVVTAG